MQEDNHRFQGMKRDNHPINQEGKFLWDAVNIRLTNRDDNTLLSITTEKGTSSKLVPFEGRYVGHCVLGKYLVVFTAVIDSDSNTTTSYIYRINKTEEGYDSVILFKADADLWNPKHPIETLGYYETELVQKVYWIDGVNQPRVINIVLDKLKGITSSNNEDLTTKLGYTTDSFDFIKKLQLKESVTINRTNGGGVFTPGTIQYAFSYFQKYGQESNIFYTSEINYISHPNRGGSPEDNVSNSFSIKIENVDTNFQYLRVYSIHRTSIDAVPSVKIVTDLAIENSNTILYTDTGNTGSSLDPTALLYIGGEAIIPQAIAAKDNTLFFGNLSYVRTPVEESLKSKFTETKNKIITDYRTINLADTNNINSLYHYKSQLNTKDITTFKVGETYRLGLQFQHTTGKWTDPVWIGDYTVPNNTSNRPEAFDNTLRLLELHYPMQYGELLQKKKFKKVRGVYVIPSLHDRMTLAQGVLCPTVFSVKDREAGSPFAQSSWFFRPMSVNDNNTEPDKGIVVQSRHLEPLRGDNFRVQEIQNMDSSTFSSANSSVKNGKKDINTFFVDQSIVTFHSPEIEFDDSVASTINNNEFELVIVGLTKFKSTMGDITVETSTPAPSPNDGGFFHRTIINSDYSNRILSTGVFYKSHLLDDTSDKISPYNEKDSKWELNWIVYPWHRTGSLNNDTVRNEGQGTRSAVLKHKVISNLRYSDQNIWIDEWSFSKGERKGITPVSIFNSNEMSLIKIPKPENSQIETINYYGNIDTLITSTNSYNFMAAPNIGVGTLGKVSNSTIDPFNSILYSLDQFFDKVGDYSEYLVACKDPVRMKYKSSPHAVFAFNYKDDFSPVILPNIGLLNKPSDALNPTEIPFWIKGLDRGSTASTVFVYSYVRNFSGLSETEVEEQCVAGLQFIDQTEGTSENTGYYAVATCSKTPSDITQADLYYKNANKVWVKQTFIAGGAGTRYRNSNGDEVWEVQVVDSVINLKKVEASDYWHLQQDSITLNSSVNDIMPCLYLAELRRKETPENMYGGTGDSAIKSNMWIPAGPPVEITDADTIDVPFRYGDTFYQRYDCLKTYPFTQEDENSIVDIASFMCETRVNIDGRYDRNRGLSSNLNVSPTNFNLMNPVYSQRDNFFNYRILDEDYYKQNIFSNQITWSKEKHSGEDVDTWTNITIANTLDMDGEKGSINALRSWNEYLMCFQDKALSQVLFNSRAQIPVSDGVPIEISNGYKVDGSRTFSEVIGCTNKWANTVTSTGIYFVDNNTDSIYLFNGQLNNLSEANGMDWWVKENHTKHPWIPINTDNEVNGIRAFYDSIYGDVYFSPGPLKKGTVIQPSALCYSEQLGQFVSFFPLYGGTSAMFNFEDGFYNLYDFPSSSIDAKSLGLYQNNVGEPNYFYSRYSSESYITFISNEYPNVTKIFDTVEIKGDVYDNDTLVSKSPVINIRAFNEYQDTRMSPTETGKRRSLIRKKFRIWRSIIPRNYGTRERIRNTWTAVTLNLASTFNTIIHDVSVKYTV